MVMKKTQLNIDFVSHIKNYIIINDLFVVNNNTKYKLDDILDTIIHILTSGSSWRSLNSDPFIATNGNLFIIIFVSFVPIMSSKMYILNY